VVVEEEERGAVSRRPSRAACGLTKMMTIEKEKRKKEGQASEVSYEMSKNFQKSHRSKIKLVTAYVEYSFNSSACACTSSIRACISSSPFPMEVHPPPPPYLELGQTLDPSWGWFLACTCCTARRRRTRQAVDIATAATVGSVVERRRLVQGQSIQHNVGCNHLSTP